MKKTILILVIILVVLAIAVGCVALYFFNGPQYAMIIIAKDVKANGMDGLEPHLTGNAEKLIEKVNSIAENPLLTTVLGLFVQNESQNVLTDYLDILKTELENVTWNLEDIMTGREHAQVMLSFNYEDDLTGTLNVSMIRTDDGWKIDGVNSLKIDGFSWDDISLPSFENFLSKDPDATLPDTENFNFKDIEIPDFENFNFEDIELPDFENFNFEDIQLPEFGIFNRNKNDTAA